VTSYLTKKLSKLRCFTGNSAGLRIVLSVVFHTQNCAFHLGNPTVSSVYLPTPRWHNRKAHPFLTIHSADEHRMIDSFTNTTFLLHILLFLFLFSDNIMADVTSKQQTTALFLSTIVTRTRRHTELTKNLTNLMGNLCCVREHSLQFFVQFFLRS
jgi:hypothetical protein